MEKHNFKGRRAGTLRNMAVSGKTKVRRQMKDATEPKEKQDKPIPCPPPTPSIRATADEGAGNARSGE